MWEYRLGSQMLELIFNRRHYDISALMRALELLDASILGN